MRPHLLLALVGIATVACDDQLRPGSDRCPVSSNGVFWTWVQRAPQVQVAVNATSGCVVLDPDGGALTADGECHAYSGWYLGASDGVLWSVDGFDAVHALSIDSEDGGVVRRGFVRFPPITSQVEPDPWGPDLRPWRTPYYFAGALPLGPGLATFEPPSGGWKPPVTLMPRLGDAGVYFQVAGIRESVHATPDWLVTEIGEEPVSSDLRPLP